MPDNRPSDNPVTHALLDFMERGGRLYHSERVLWESVPDVRPVIERLARYRAETERLREALKHIANVRRSDCYVTSNNEAEMRRLARQALDA